MTVILSMEDSIITVVTTLVLAVSAVASVIVAACAAHSFRRSIKLQAKSQVLKEYSSVAMGKHISNLYAAFLDDKRKEEMIACFDSAWETKDFSNVDKEVNDARRRIAWYFTKMHSLYESGMLKKSDVKGLTEERQIHEFLLCKVRRLDRPDRRCNKVYAFFKELYPYKNDGG